MFLGGLGQTSCSHDLRAATSHSEARVILWCLRAYADPDGEYSGGENDVLDRKIEIQLHESHREIATARGKAEAIKAELLNKGFTE